MAEVCNLNTIYNKEFSFSLPRKILQSFIDGNSFDRKEMYTEDEKGRLLCDIESIYNAMMARKPEKKAVAIMTAGGPGAGKTTLLRQAMERRKNNFAYVDPDDVCLKQMEKTYLADIAKAKTAEDRRKAYNDWRPGSNAANQICLANLIREKIGFYFGTTSTSPQTNIFLKFLKDNGYSIEILHISAPDNVRIESIRKVSESFIHVTDEDLVEKGKMLPQRIQDTYLAFADTLRFFYRGSVDENARLAATWSRTKEGKGKLHVKDPETLEKIRSLHDTACRAMGRIDLLWENTVEKSLQ